MPKFIFHVSQSKLADAIKLVDTYNKWYNTPKWDKAKIKFDKKFTIHETKTGTVVVNEIL
jgi:hypothetical protein